MKLPYSCAICVNLSKTCPVLFKVKRARKNKYKRFILKKCVCTDCVVKASCKQTCSLSQNYLNSIKSTWPEHYHYTFNYWLKIEKI